MPSWHVKRTATVSVSCRVQVIMYGMSWKSGVTGNVRAVTEFPLYAAKICFWKCSTVRKLVTYTPLKLWDMPYMISLHESRNKIFLYRIGLPTDRKRRRWIIKLRSFSFTFSLNKLISYPFHTRSKDNEYATWNLRSALFWDITQRWVVVLYRRFGTNYLSHLQGSWTSWPLKMGPIGFPETSVQNYHSTLCNIPEARRSQLLSGGSMSSRVVSCLYFQFDSILF